MHDILAHSVSLMVVQAVAGPVVVRSDPAVLNANVDERSRDAIARAARAVAGRGRTCCARPPVLGGRPRDGFMFTGSVLLPVKAALTNPLSIGAVLGAVVWVFQQGNLG
ncbi:MAG TPA: hypothetical protein VI011_21465, partial [Asanoa sp.]